MNESSSWSWLAAAGVVGILSISGPAVAGSLDLTGTWEGQAVCDELIDGEYTLHVFPDPLEITQVGDRVRVSGFGVLYEGTIQRLKGGPNDGEAMIHACGGVPENEVVRIQHIVTKGNDEGRLDANTHYESDFFFPGQRAYGTCKWNYNRVSSKDPEVLACD
jgi:hypothetical protein